LRVAEKRVTVVPTDERVTQPRKEQRKDQRKPLNSLLCFAEMIENMMQRMLQILLMFVFGGALLLVGYTLGRSSVEPRVIERIKVVPTSPPTARLPPPSGVHSFGGMLVDSGKPVANLKVDYHYSFRPGASGSVRLSTYTDASGRFCFTNQPDYQGSLRWAYSIPGGSITFDRTFNPSQMTVFDLNIRRTSAITGKLVDRGGASATKDTQGIWVYLTRIEPTSINIDKPSTHTTEEARDFGLKLSHAISEIGTFTWDGLPSGTYLVTEPGIRPGRGTSGRPPIFDPVVVQLGPDERRPIVITVKQ
jgi:hypothetical protein